MGGIIKANDERARRVRGVAFNFDDVTSKADDYLAKVGAEAEELLETAKQEAEAIRQQAEQAGRRTAEQKAEEGFDRKVAKQCETLLPALREAIGEIREMRESWIREWEENVVRLATAIAERVIRRELERSPEIPLGLVREAVELAAGSPKLRVHLSREDYDAFAPQVEVLLAELAHLAETEVAPDDAISPGGCRVETQFGTIDQQIESQLARIEEELL